MTRPPAFLPGIVAFEWRYQTRRLTYAATLLLLSLVPLTTVATGFGPAALAVNSPYVIAETTAILTLVSVFALPMLCVGAAVRDDEYRMRELITSRPVPARTLLTGRLIGVLLAGAAVLLLAMLMLAIMPFVVPVPDGRLLPFHAVSYLWCTLIFVIPNLLFCTTVLFLVATLSRSTLATFVAAIAIYCGYFVTAMMVDSPLVAGTRPPTPELLARVAVLDPFGLSAFFEQSRYWTPMESNVRLPTLTGRLLLNRVLVLGVSAALLTLVPWIERRRVRRRVAPKEPVGTAASPPRSPVGVLRVAPALSSFGTLRSATGAVFRLEGALLLRSWPLRVLLVLWSSMIAIEAFSQLGGGEYGTRLLASSAVMADTVPMALWLMGTLCAHYFAADVVWRERVLGFDGIRDATPVANAALLVGKIGALMLVPVALAVTGFGVALLVHLVAGGLPVEWRVYGAHFVTALAPLLITTVVAIALQLLTGNRWIGMFAGLVLAYVVEDGETLGLEHPLLRFGAAPALQWSDLDGFGAPLASYIAFQGLWALGAVVLMGAAAVLWPRGTVTSWTRRMRGLPGALQQGLTARGRWLLLGATAVFAAAYGAMAWQTVRVANWQSEDASNTWRADYEKSWRHLAGSAQPSIVHVDVRVELEPERRRAEFRTTLVIENRTQRPIDTIWVVPPNDASGVTITMARTTQWRDDRFGVVRLVRATPMPPGAFDTLHVTLGLDRGGLRADGFAQDVAGNGTFLWSTTFLPSFGYQPRLELAPQNQALRTRYGLGPSTDRLVPAAQRDSLASATHAHGVDPAWLTVHTTVITSPDQIAIAPGERVREWLEEGRRAFSYRLDTPSTPLFVIASGRYAVVRRQSDGVAVELYHHRPHGVQADRIVDIAATSIRTLQQQFGPYPHSTLRVVEVPASWRFGAFAANGAIFLTESRGMLSDARDDDVDLLLRRIGHEVGHQWWGHTIDPLPLDGGVVLVESLAKYSEQLLLQESQGAEGVSRMMAYDEDRYLAGRASIVGVEPTLAATRDEAWMYYGKGAMAFHALRASLGDSAIVRALRGFIAAEGGPRGAPHVDQLVEALRAAARDDESLAEIDEWFHDRIVWEMARDSTAPATIITTPSGVRVAAQFRVSRVRSDSAGMHAVSAHGRLVDIAIGDDSAGVARTLVSLRARVSGDVARVDTVLPTASLRARHPAWVAIDPSYRRIDRDRSNNRARLDSALRPVPAETP